MFAVFDLLDKMCVHVMVSDGLSGLGKYFSVVIFCDTVNVLSVTHLHMVLFTEPYLVIQMSVAPRPLRCQSNSISWKLCSLVSFCLVRFILCFSMANHIGLNGAGNHILNFSCIQEKYLSDFVCFAFTRTLMFIVFSFFSNIISVRSYDLCSSIICWAVLLDTSVHDLDYFKVMGCQSGKTVP